MCYTGDTYVRVNSVHAGLPETAEQIVDAGAHVLAIKDMAYGLLRPPAAQKVVGACAIACRIYLHPTPGGQLASYVALARRGRCRIDSGAAA